MSLESRQGSKPTSIGAGASSSPSTWSLAYSFCIDGHHGISG